MAPQRSLIRTRTVLAVLDYLESDGRAAYASDPDREGGARTTTLYLDGDVYADMGDPSTITVTVEPGDLLNVGAV